MSQKEVAEDYRTALQDLDNNSKPLITMLTMLADENKKFASVITQVIVTHLKDVPTSHKLPTMYLVDSIVKNVRDEYTRLFSNVIATVFSRVFREVDEKTRKKMYELRQTWNEVFPKSRLYILDVNINEMDPAWPITSHPTLGSQSKTTIHINPNKFSPQSLKPSFSIKTTAATTSNTQDIEELKKLQTEKKALEETRRKVEKMMKEKLKLGESSTKATAPEPNPTCHPDRRTVLRNFKIKKKYQLSADKPASVDTKEKQVISNIHVAPWKAKDFLPSITSKSSSPPDITKTPITAVGPHSKDSNFPNVDSSKEQRKASMQSEIQRDPRLPAPRDIPSTLPKSYPSVSRGNIQTRRYSPSSVLRDPRLASKTVQPSHIGSGIQKTALVTDPRLNSSEVKKLEKEKRKQSKEREVSVKSSKKDGGESSGKEKVSPYKKDNKKVLDDKYAKEKDKKDKELKEKNEKEERDKKEKAAKKEKDEKDQKEKEEREKKAREDKERSVKELKELMEEMEKKEREEKERKAKEELERKEFEEKENRAREERERTEKLLRERIEKELREEEELQRLKKQEAARAKEEKVECAKIEQVQFKKEEEMKIKDRASKHKGKTKTKGPSPCKKSKDMTPKEAVSKEKCAGEGQPEKSTKSHAAKVERSGSRKKTPLLPSGAESHSSSDEKFKNQKTVSSGSSKRREHIRSREKSPEPKLKPDDITESPNTDSANSSKGSDSGVKLSSSGTKRIRTRRNSESDDSDHYDANKPPPAAYVVKKAKTDSVDLSVKKDTPFLETPSADTDLRLLTPQTKPEISLSDTLKSKSSHIGDLFGTSDTDLRQLPLPTVQFPLGIPTTATGVPPGVVPLNPYIAKPDQDFRDKRLPMNMREGQENKDPRFRRHIHDKVALLHSPENNEEGIGDAPSKKFSFSSPHAAKWEKFREKNPEFKEYQRQASTSDKPEMEVEEDQQFNQNRESNNRGRLRGRGHVRRGRGPESHGISYPTGEKQDWFGEQRDAKSEENYQFMISHLNDQLKRGEINPNYYGKMLADIRHRMEMDKIREVQEKEKGGAVSERRLQGMEREGKSGSRWANRPFGEKADTDSFHADDSRWQRWNRGRGRGGGAAPLRPGVTGLDTKIEDEWTGEADLPTVSEEVLRSVTKESETRTIDIDGIPREIRAYGEKAVILMDWNDPRTITFETMSCNIVFDEGKFKLSMNTREDYREFKIDGENHRVKLGVPTQELMIDGKGYQCFFGGKPISVHLAGQDRTIRLDGKPPKVDIGLTKNFTYLAGKVELVINARKIIPLFLDAKPQRFNVDGVPFIIKIVDSFRAVLINGVKFPVEFGSLPISISVRGYRRFLRFSALPNEIIPGKTRVEGMDADGTTLIPSYPRSPSPPKMSGSGFPSQINPPVVLPSSQMIPPIQPTAPVLNPLQNFSLPTGSAFSQLPHGPPLLPPNPFINPPPQPPLNVPVPPLLPGVVGIGFPMTGVIPGSYHTTGAPQQPPTSSTTITPLALPPAAKDTLPQQPPPCVSVPTRIPAPTIDVHSLLRSLVKTGIIGGSKKEVPKETAKEKKGKKEAQPKEDEEEDDDIDDLKDLPPIDFMFNLDNLRKRNDKLIKRMHRGIQCSSCGLRYPPEQTAQYSHHLDWHFRMNKKQQESIKKVNTKKFHLCIDDWLQYEEIEDSDERVPSMFEMEGEADSKTREAEEEDAEEIPSVAASSSDPRLGVCPVCHETFDQFYHHSTEEWHYKYAVHVDGINYHPACHQDLVKAQKQEEERLKKEEEERLKKEEEERLKKEEEERLKKEESERLKMEDEERLQHEDDEQQKNKKLKIEEEKQQEGDEKLKKEVEEKEVTTGTKQEEDSEVIAIDDELKNEEVAEEEDHSEHEITELEVPKEKIEEIPILDDSDAEEATKDETPMKPDVKASVQNSPLNFKIKDEQMETDDGFQIIQRSLIPPILADIPIKVEIPDDDDEEEEENNPPTFDIDDDEMQHDGSEDNMSRSGSWTTPVVADTVISSSIDGNTELSTEPENSQSSVSVPKIKISVSRPILNNVDGHMNANKLNNNSIVLSKGLCDEFPDDFVPPPFTVNLSEKPAFKGVQLIELPTEHRGVELSSLCSIM